MKIDCSFPAGNIIVEKIEGDSVWLHQDLRDTDGDWFYWYFRVSGAEGRTVRFHFTQSAALGARGPAYSVDGGKSWRWLGRETVEENSFVHTFAPDETAALFSMTIPYTETAWKQFLPGLSHAHPWEEGVLCRSRQGRAVESLRLGSLHGTPRHRVLLAARHHACETMASYALEGLVASVFADDPEALWLREQVEFLVIPFVDKDGVEAGDQGKNRRPRDHNRSYDGERLYPETAALMETIPAWSRGRLSAALDFHCPWLMGHSNESIYQVGSPLPAIWEEQKQFSAILQSVRSGPLPFQSSDDMPYGQDWNVAANFSRGKSFCDWITTLPEIRFASSLEVPYANARGVEVNPATARRFGADLARALASYLQSR